MLEGVLQADRPRQEDVDAPTLGGRQGNDRGQTVDKVAVAFLRGNTARRGVGLDEIAFILQGRHVISDRC